MAKVYQTTFAFGGELNPTFSSAVDKARDGIKGLEKEAGKAEGVFGQLTKSVGGFGKIVSRVAQYTGAFALVTGVTDAIGNMTSSIVGFQDSMAQLQASTGATVQDMQELSESAKNLYTQNLGEDWNDVANSLSLVKQVTDQTGADLENTTKNAIVFRDVFGEEIQESIKATDTMMKNFGITSDQAYNLLAQGAQKGLNKSDELLDTANEYSPYFSALGFSANQMFDTFSAGLESGAFNLDKVGDAVKEFNIRVKDDSKTTNEAFAALGFNANEMAQTFARGGPAAQKAFTQVVDAISKVQDPVQKNILGVKLFGTQFEDLEKDVIAAMGSARSQFDMTKSTIDEITNVKYSTATKAIQGIGRQIMTGIIMPIGDLALPALQGFSDWLGKSITKVTDFFSNTGQKVGPFVTEAYENLQWLFENGFDGEMKGVTINYAKMLGISETDASEIANGIGRVFSNIADIKDDFISSWEIISPSVQNVFQSIQEIVMQVVPIFQKVGIGVWEAATKITKSLMPVGVFIQSKLWPIITKVFGFLANDVAPAISHAFSAMVPTFVSVAGKVGNTVSALFNLVKPVIDGLVGAFNFAFPFIKATVLSAINSVSGILNGLMTTLGGVLDFITGVFTGDWSKAWTGVKEIFGGVFDGLAALLKAPINAVISLINQAFQSIGSISIDIPDWVPGMGGEKLSFSFPEIPMLEAGGIATGPTLAMVGEGTEDEAILPLSKLESLLGYGTATAPTSGGGSGDIYLNYSPKIMIEGSNNQDAQGIINQALDLNLRKLEQMLRDLKRDQQRRAFVN
ncbi:phage tail tape measure protein [Brevibacillus fulvus]|uniref:Phage-related minor tail protein n=1 Tax=Brevibacillus fulvus TaxID=1125967 RepID=A0A938XXY4_9BACL|nr:phage tail tape measure protein [Brevibacillus fulvus]MBM7592252.1 phage-related minor tail protein [Brevibacillus fulvus]